MAAHFQPALILRLSSVHVVHPDLHSDPVQAHHLQWLCVSRLVSSYWLRHGSVLGDLHTRLCPLQDFKVPRSHLQRGTVLPLVQLFLLLEWALVTCPLWRTAYTLQCKVTCTICTQTKYHSFIIQTLLQLCSGTSCLLSFSLVCV